MIKKQIQKYSALEKIFAYLGLAIAIIGIVTSMYNGPRNAEYVQDGLDIMYYNRYIIVLGGGFLVGLLMYLRSKSLAGRLFGGAVYMGVTFALYNLIDYVRVLLMPYMTTLGFPWGKVVFSVIPLVALVLSAIMAIVFERRAAEVSKASKIVLIASFTLIQLYEIVQMLYYTLFVNSGVYFANTSVGVTIPVYLASPVAIAIVAYIVLSSIKSKFVRLFYAVLLALSMRILALVVWEFNTQPSVEMANAFTLYTSLLVIVVAAAVLWRGRATTANVK